MRASQSSSNIKDSFDSESILERVRKKQEQLRSIEGSKSGESNRPKSKSKSNKRNRDKVILQILILLGFLVTNNYL